MYKKISVVILGISILLCGFTSKSNEFSYKYEVVLNSNDNKDVIKGYLYKEYLIDRYNDLIMHLDASLHTNAVMNNIEIFAKEGSVSKYVNGKIIVYIGQAQGSSIEGSLKTNVCDNSNLRVKFFFSKFFVK